MKITDFKRCICRNDQFLGNIDDTGETKSLLWEMEKDEISSIQYFWSTNSSRVNGFFIK
jgi:hypothetical protein